jgi:hypothetical protein
MIEHMIKVSQEVFNGTAYEDNWFFYHDALSLMTAKDTIAWMKEKGYYKHWILPENGLQEDDPDTKKYKGRPVGDCMELMPWDNNLNQDVHISVERHVAWTSFLPTGDRKKFDMSSPKRGADAYLRILDPGANGVCPKSERIVGDVMKVLDSMETIRAAGGIIVEGCGSRHGGGRWQQQAAVQRGGYKPRQQPLFEYSEFDMHVDAVQARNDRVARSVALHTSIDAEEEEEEELALEEAQDAVDGEGGDGQE